jgi:hypothetical protein
LELAKGVVYSFRTLSFYDVWELWPHIMPLLKKLDRPLEWIEHIQAVLAILNPTLASTPEHMELVRPVHVTILIDFYRRQDWPRIGVLGGYLASADSRATVERTPSPKDETDRRFMAICIGAARSVDMSPLEFMQERFEFCADVIINLREAMEEEARRGKIPMDKFVGLMQAVMPGVRVTDENKPAWMREVEEYARNAEKN